MKTCPFISHLLGDEQSEILTLESAESHSKSSKGKQHGKGPKDSSISPHLLCLMESCRFYEQTEKSCGFDTLLSTMRKMQDATSTHASMNDTVTPRVTKELNKFWKFQTKSVTEIISQMSEIEKQQRKNLDAFKYDLQQQIEKAFENNGESSQTKDAEEIRKMCAGMEELQNMLREKEEDSTDSTSGISEFTSQLEQSMQEMKSKTDSLCGTIEQLTGSLPTGVDEAIHDLQDQQRSLDERLSALASGQDELLSFFKADKNRREVEWLRSNKKEARMFNNLGVSSYHSGAFETAKEQFAKAIEMDPEFAEVYNNLGLVYTELGEEEMASDAFKKATELKPDMTAAYSNLGYLFHKQGSYEQAVEMYNEALGRSSKSSPAYTNLGNAYFKLGKSAEAEEAWEKALEIDPSNEQAALYLKQLRAEKL
jgi:tetratricopeptide (TPR) repeat protein